MIDYRKLLKDCIRGQLYDRDIPVIPCGNPGSGSEACSDEELEAYFVLVWEAFREDCASMDVEDGASWTAEERENVRRMRERNRREIEQLEREAFGLASSNAA
jgi:hypothetical protein